MHTLVEDVGSESEVVFWPGLPVGETVRRQLESKRALRSERWARVGKRVPLLPSQTFRSVIGSPFWHVVHILGPAHELLAVCLGRALMGKPVREGH